MKILKFGGGCLKSSEEIKKIPKIIDSFKGEKILLVLSAFGKLTNMLEQKKYDEIYQFLSSLMNDLGFSTEQKEKLTQMPIAPSFEGQCFNLNFIQFLKSNELDYPTRICVGEYISCIIIQHFLSKHSIYSIIFDAALSIKTHKWNLNSQSAKFDYCIKPNKSTFSFYNSNGFKEKKMFSEISKNIFITQGFIASESSTLDVIKTSNLKRSTLGREGSDYSAAIFGKMFNVDQIILFKDVDGVYDSDPKKNSHAKLYKELSYQDAINICDNTATIIHPNTIRYLMKFNIPILVKNYNNMKSSGTYIF